MSESIRVLVLGSGGMLGQGLTSALAAAGGFSVRGARRSDGYDFSRHEDLARCFSDSGEIDWCVNCVAYTDTKAAEETAVGRHGSWKMNALFPGYVAEECASRGIRAVHVSTDYVFSQMSSARRDFLRPESRPFPVNRYGMDKYAGELAFRQGFAANSSRYAVLRTSWLYGAAGKKSFVHKFLKAAVSAARSGKKAEMTSDEESVPTSVSFLSGRVIDVIRDGMRGVFHAVPAADKPVSRARFAKEILRAALPFFGSEFGAFSDPEKFVVSVRRPDKLQPAFSAMASDWPGGPDWLSDLREFIVREGCDLAEWAVL